jgi:hypothetical protein
MWKNVGFDGLWLDMNEAANFCNGGYPECNGPNPGPRNSFKQPKEFTPRKYSVVDMLKKIKANEGKFLPKKIKEGLTLA